jgi:hypothetical protein
VSAGIN